jgi:hypothetical protein
MKLTIRDGVMTVDDATPAETAELATLLKQASAGSSPARRNGAEGDGAREAKGSHGRSPVPPDSPRIPVANKREALTRFYDEIQIADHKKLLRVLAGAGSKGLDQDQLKKRAGVTKGLAGFGNSIFKRTKAYGLVKADVLLVEKRGVFSQKRQQIFSLSEEMLQIMRERGLVELGSN